MEITNFSFDRLTDFLFRKVSIAPLIIFRIFFGLLLLYGTYRTYEKGWIEELYIYPMYHFGFFSWIEPLSGNGMYYVFLALGITAVGIMLGSFYRISVFLHFVLFTYVELIDKTYYLNHYYLVSLLTFWMIWVPANRWFSIDSLLFPKIKSMTCSNWHILIFKVQLSIVYFFAGLAKVNSDWLFRAQPLATWLPGKYQLPIIGSWMHLKAVAFFFSWAGCAYDLTIWIFLWIKKTRGIAYFFVIVFHVLTGILFPRIGMFPFIMITSTIIFFSSEWHERVLNFLGGKFSATALAHQISTKSPQPQFLVTSILAVYIIIQLYLPIRYLQYPGDLFWHEQGYRFSWRVMLMEKNGYTSFILRDPVKAVQSEVNQNNYLTPFQKQQMRSQPDMLIQFGKHLGDEFKEIYGYAPEVFVKSRISLNGRRSQVFTNDSLDIYKLKDPMKHNWITPFIEKE